MTTDEGIDIAGPTSDAWAAAEAWADHYPADAENMATLAELGELLATGRTDPDLARECRELVDRSIRLATAAQHEWEQAWALAWARRGPRG